MRTLFEDPTKLLIFSSELDPAALLGGEASLLRALRATTAMKVSLVLGDRIPVLAENQVFDSPLTFGLFDSSEKSGDREKEMTAFLWLVEHDYIQVRVHDSGPSNERQGDRYTLRGACAAALMKRDFLLSGWPGLTYEERIELAKIFKRETTNQPPPNLRDRVNAIEKLDDALRGNESSERARHVERSLDGFIQDDLDQRAGASPEGYLQRWFSNLRRFAEDVGGESPPKLEGQTIASFDLNYRSHWRRLIATYRDVNADRFDPAHGAFHAASAMVDLAYNRKVAISLGAPYQRETALDSAAQELVSEDPDTIKLSKEAAFLTERTDAQWLSWDFVKERLEQGRVPNEKSSYREQMRGEVKKDLLETKVSVRVDAGLVHSGYVWLSNIRAGIEAAGGVIGAAGGVLVLREDPLVGAAVGAGAGAAGAHYLGRMDPIPALREWRIGQGVKALVAELETHIDAVS